MDSGLRTHSFLLGGQSSQGGAGETSRTPPVTNLVGGKPVCPLTCHTDTGDAGGRADASRNERKTGHRGWNGATGTRGRSQLP